MKTSDTGETSGEEKRQGPVIIDAEKEIEKAEAAAAGQPAVYRLINDPKRIVALLGALLFMVGANLLMFTLTDAAGAQTRSVTLWNGFGAGSVLGKISVIFLLLGVVCLVTSRIRGALLGGMISLFLLAVTLVVSALQGRTYYGEESQVSLGLGGLLALLGLIVYQTALMMVYMQIVLKKNPQTKKQD
ncbi:MAG: hypothetical protein ACOX78_05440 [Lachnospiraceae bacterium]|jgi:hypothetical protein